MTAFKTELLLITNLFSVFFLSWINLLALVQSLPVLFSFLWLFSLSWVQRESCCNSCLCCKKIPLKVGYSGFALLRILPFAGATESRWSQQKLFWIMFCFVHLSKSCLKENSDEIYIAKNCPFIWEYHKVFHQ